MTFFDQLNFTSANEDGRSELSFLCETPPRRLLCLAGSGTRAFDLLLGDPQEVIALDLNPAQCALVTLKMAAIEVLEESDLHAYLGLTGDAAQRLVLHRRVTAKLPVEAREFWGPRERMIAQGVWYAGLWERVLRFGARATRLVRGRQIDRLFAAPSLAEQADLWRRHFDDWIWRAALRTLGRRFVWTHIVGEPGGAFLPEPREVESRLRAAFQHAAATFFFRDSDFASLILRGYHALPHAVPLHLQPGYLATVRDRLSRIRVVEGGLHELPRLGVAEIDAFSLSDFGSYCTPQAYAACWDGVMRAAAPGARVCERIFLNDLPSCFAIAWDDARSARLTNADTSFIYKIRVGAVPGGQGATRL